MITLPGGAKVVFEIMEGDIRIPEKVTQESPFKPGKTISKYVAPSTSVLVNLTNSHTELVIGREANVNVLRTVLGFGLKNKKPLVILKCEVLSNLLEFDRMVVLCNSIIKQQEGTDVDLKELFNSRDDTEGWQS